jgi:hypothetical protein
VETPNRRVSGPLGTAPVGASTRAGLPVIAASPRGRDAQAIAFPSTPDTVPLYSGGTTISASAAATALGAAPGDVEVFVIEGQRRRQGADVRVGAGGRVGDGGFGEPPVCGVGAEAAEEDRSFIGAPFD